MSDPVDRVYSGVAAFAAELVRRGVTEVVISPGSRSTPLAVTLHAQPMLRTWIQLDERSAGFFALGMARVSGRPPVLVCTSGTAAANYLPALVEAHHAGVPVIACTADRPPELRGWGAGQTIDQVKMFGPHTRWAADLAVSSETGVEHCRTAAMRAVAEATGRHPGPVHLNWPFREPLEPVGDVPVEPAEPATGPAAGVATSTPDTDNPLPELAGRERGVVVVGPAAGTGLRSERAVADSVERFAAAAGWPVIGEPMTHVRRSGRNGALVVSAADVLLAGDEFARAMVPDVVVRVGRSPTTKPVRLWLERHRPERVVLVDPEGHWNEASFTITDHVTLDAATALVPRDTIPRSTPWLDAWARAEDRAQRAVSAVVDDGPLLSAAVARTVLRSLPPQSLLMASNSMPVRDLDRYSGGSVEPIVVGNRGASGIDGINSTTLGLAAAHPDRAAALLTGDLALLHDLGGLLAAARLDLHLTVVCVDNDGGGIFSLLPIAARGSAVDFETLFRTPHGTDLVGLDGLGGIRAQRVGSAADLGDTVLATMTSRRVGVDLVVVPVDRDADVAQHREVTASVSAAVSDASSGES